MSAEPAANDPVDPQEVAAQGQDTPEMDDEVGRVARAAGHEDDDEDIPDSS